ncbi:MAG: CDP-glycerol glycerophosphotransferase family protein [Lachnospiraceae bacterium]|nr:CDP-glycerol glycerophosphotransferase family protein [Lachnospiraceae bacterium]
MSKCYMGSEKPYISMICLDADAGDLEEYLSTQENVAPIEYVQFTSEDSYQDIIKYIYDAQGRYICFFEAGHVYAPDRIHKMSEYLEKTPDVQVVISPRNFIDADGNVICTSDKLHSKYLGLAVLEYSIRENSNVYGDLSAIMVSAEYAKRIPWDIPEDKIDSISRIAFLYQFLLYGNAGFLDVPLVSVRLRECNDQAACEKAAEFENYTRYLYEQKLLESYWKRTSRDGHKPVPVKKEITLFYTDKGEYYNLKPIADKAALRGYTVAFTDNLTEEAEIGIYCQHTAMIESVNAKFSLILLHDMAQGHNRWPNIWYGEPWNRFDIGIVPGKTWADRWSQCACDIYANPRCGTFALGYPKSDLTESLETKERARLLSGKFHLKYDFSVLYAPSWENNEKEDDFIRACASLKVNLLIKQCKWPAAFDHINKNNDEMRALHEGRFDNVYYIEPEESIMTALELCDMVVSDESSVMAEAAMFGKPSLAVTDWLIPDTVPIRYACCPMEYVLKCRKVELREYVEMLSSHTISKAQIDDIIQKGQHEFANKGSCCDDILDAIAYYTGGEAAGTGFLSKKVESRYEKCALWN